MAERRLGCGSSVTSRRRAASRCTSSRQPDSRSTEPAAPTR